MRAVLAEGYSTAFKMVQDLIMLTFTKLVQEFSKSNLVHNWLQKPLMIYIGIFYVIVAFVFN